MAKNMWSFPVYGDSALLAQLLPQGTKLDAMTVCGSSTGRMISLLICILRVSRPA